VEDDPHKSRAFLIFANSRKTINDHVHQEFVEIKPYFRNVLLDRVGTLTEQEAFDLAAKCFSECSDAKRNTAEYLTFGEERYFEVLLAGLHQFRLEGEKVSDDNIYLKFFVKGVKAGVIDRKMERIIANTSWLKRKIENKFEDMQNIICGLSERVPPIRLIQQTGGAWKFKTPEGDEIACSEIDGHHRFFTCQLMGTKRIHCQIISKDRLGT
jgi:hypothetical protein